ncbi:MAG: hypothetical protein IPK07_24925 [Deltaproteobacteria bacterium]|nr:hypothetical protein [Deltaproteobacteria bacterium]
MLLIATSALVIFALGAMHCWLTFRGDALHPRDEALTQRMSEVSPRLTRETTMWRAWVSFNASHGFGAMLFGLVFGYLALEQPRVLRASPFLLVVGAAILGGYVFLGRRYWFSVPRRGVLAAAALYAGGVLSLWG